MTYTVGSLFAGIGGVCTGFKQAGCNIEWANEYDKHACMTYRHNFPETTLHEKDIHSIRNPSSLGNVDILTSGFPCQAFSVAGYRKGFDDHRGNLFFETARFIEEIQPKAYLLENVKNLVGHDKGNTFRVIRETMEHELGYSFLPFVLNAKKYGNIPQTRERIYVVGFKNEFKGINSCSSNFNVPEEIELTNTIHSCLINGKKDDSYYYKEGHRYYPILAETIKSKDTLYQWRRTYVRENKSNVCPTLTANMGTGGHNVPLLIDGFGVRKLTPKECVNFQGFPQEFNFPENMAKSHCYKQAGNSVVVPVVKRIADELVRVLDFKYGKTETTLAPTKSQQVLEFS